MKIVVGGQIDKQRIADMARALGGDKVSVEIMGDIQAAMAVKSGAADLYLGACNTGGGGALSMAIAILTLANCATVSMPGNIMSDAQIIAEVENGKRAFGFTAQDIDQVMPVLMQAALKKYA